MKKSIFLTIIFLGLIITSCKKDESNEKANLLCGKVYGLSAATYKEGSKPETDLFTFMDNCVKDNTVLFNTNGTAVEDEGATKCNAADPQTKNTNWSFNADKTQLNHDNEWYNILVLDGTTLKIEYQSTDSAGAVSKTTYTMVKK